MIEGLGKQLNLDRRQVEPSFNSLYWWAQHPFPDTPPVRLTAALAQLVQASGHGGRITRSRNQDPCRERCCIRLWF